jgi:hypothetical protein
VIPRASLIRRASPIHHALEIYHALLLAKELRSLLSWDSLLRSRWVTPLLWAKRFQPVTPLKLVKRLPSEQSSRLRP